MQELLAAWATVAHDGSVRRGTLPEGVRDNYMAAMAAQLETAATTGVRRVIIVFDATSPVEALLRFMRSCHKKRRRKYRCDWLDAWARALERFEVVVFLWQTLARRRAAERVGRQGGRRGGEERGAAAGADGGGGGGATDVRQPGDAGREG